MVSVLFLSIYAKIEIAAPEINVINNAVFPVEQSIWSQWSQSLSKTEYDVWLLCCLKNGLGSSKILFLSIRQANLLSSWAKKKLC